MTSGMSKFEAVSKCIQILKGNYFESIHFCRIYFGNVAPKSQK